MRRTLEWLERLPWAAGLELVLPGEAPRRYGPSPPAIRWHFRDRGALRRILRNPEWALGETYLEGAWRVEGASLAEFLRLLVRSAPDRNRRPGRLRRLAALVLQQFNRVRASYANAARHYDQPDWLFERFLDRDLHYSCAYWAEPTFTLEEAQQAKCAHLAEKLLLEPGMEVLDVGSGWGSLALYLARHAGVRVTGITLSRRQLEVAARRARQQGLDGQVRFLLEDYRQHRGTYDRVVSVGMFEHVGRPYYETYFRTLRAALRPDGLGVVHSITRLGPPAVTNAWVRRYIFPGGYNPSLSELVAGVERGGLMVADVEILRLHYAHTLAAWQARFQAARQEVAERLGERFARMWEFYLAAAEAAMSAGDLAVAQVQLAEQLDRVPITRDYLYRTVTAPVRRTGT